MTLIETLEALEAKTLGQAKTSSFPEVYRAEAQGIRKSINAIKKAVKDLNEEVSSCHEQARVSQKHSENYEYFEGKQMACVDIRDEIKDILGEANDSN